MYFGIETSNLAVFANYTYLVKEKLLHHIVCSGALFPGYFSHVNTYVYCTVLYWIQTEMFTTPSLSCWQVTTITCKSGSRRRKNNWVYRFQNAANPRKPGIVSQVPLPRLRLCVPRRRVRPHGRQQWEGVGHRRQGRRADGGGLCKGENDFSLDS